MANEPTPDQNPQQIAEENRNALDLGSDNVEARQPEQRPAGEPAKEDEAEARKPVIGSKFDDKRKAIAEKAKQLRDGDPEIEDQIYATRERMFGKNVERPEPVANQPEPPQPAPKRKLKVNGQEIELDEAQVVAAAQKALAAGDILEQAKRDRAEAHTLLEGLRAAKANQPAAEPSRPSPQPTADTRPEDEAELDEIVDRIQVGDRKDASAALKKYGDAIIDRVLERIGNLDETIASQVAIVNENTRRQQNTADTLRSFGDDNPEFKESRSLQAALAQEAADTMRAKMFALGVEPQTLETLKVNRGMNDIQAVSFAYRALQENGHELPSHVDILTESAAAIRKQFGMPERRQPAPLSPANINVQDRQERKRAMTPQPRRANTPPNTEPHERSREEVRRLAVRQMKMARRGRA